jgi:hypothetical protein
MFLGAVAVAVLAVVLFVIALANADGVACPPGQPAEVGVNADGSVHNSCGGTDPLPLFIAAAVALGAAACLAVAAHRGRSVPR